MSIEDIVDGLEHDEKISFSGRDPGNVLVEVVKSGVPSQSRVVARDNQDVIEGVVVNLLSVVRRAAL